MKGSTAYRKMKKANQYCYGDFRDYDDECENFENNNAIWKKIIIIASAVFVLLIIVLNILICINVKAPSDTDGKILKNDFENVEKYKSEYYPIK